MTRKEQVPDSWSGYGEFAALVEAYDGLTYWFERGYGATFRFWLAEGIEKEKGRHPYRYELVLHDPGNKRILGYDNAHPIKWKSGKFKHRSENPDHYHRDRSDTGRPYEFMSLTKLLSDFFSRTTQVLQQLNVSSDITEITPTPRTNLPRSSNENH